MGDAVIRVGLVGAGAVASWCHIPALRRVRGASLVAVADVNAAALDRVRRAHGIATHSSPEALLSRADVDAVVIAVPPGLHADVACAAAAAGKAIYLEKPVATTLPDANRIVDAVAAAGAPCVTGFNRRLHPLFVQARQLLQRGAIGRLASVHMAFCEPAPPDGLPAWKRTRATGGGALLDLASHHVDLLRWFTDDDIGAVRATTASAESEQDSAEVSLTTQQGVQAHGFYSFRAGYADHLEFQGDRGTLRVDRHRARLWLRRSRAMGYGTAMARPFPTPAVAAWWLRRSIRRHEDPSYYHALRAFVRQVAGGPAANATLRDGVRSLEIVLAAERSARSGATVHP